MAVIRWGGVFVVRVCILSVPVLLCGYGIRVFTQLLSLIASLTLVCLVVGTGKAETEAVSSTGRIAWCLCPTP